MAGEFTPGQSVRVEAVGDALDVSATPVREALHALRVEGFLELIPRKGFTVASLVADDIRDILGAHALIAGELTARAAERIEPAQLDHLGRVQEQLIDAAQRGDHERLEQLNHEFHRDVYLIAGSGRLRWAVGMFVKYVPNAFYSQIDGWPETTVAAHSAILEALRNRDAEKARTSMARHISNSGELLAESFDRRSAPE